MFGSDDITWCGSECTYEGCFRNPINMKDRTGLHSYAKLQGTDLCTLANIEVTTKERGWAGHYISSKNCLFRRNTLITCGNVKWVVSTVGNYRSNINLPELNIKVGDIQTIGYNRWYETMVFESKYDVYDDADVTKEIDCDFEWGIWGETWDDVIKKYGKDVDNAANAIHDRIVKEMKIKIREAYVNAKASDIVQRADN